MLQNLWDGDEMTKDYNNELLNDCAWFAEKHRGKNKQSGAHWSTIIRFPKLFDEAVRLQKRIAELEAEKEQVCEWVEPTNNPYGDLYIPLCNDDKTFEIESINEYNYCPNCGKRIVYNKSEGG